MTDKQIIIDGVDVARCKYLFNTDFEFDKHVHCSEMCCRNRRCRNNPNCYYKQLQRKTQECEELKAQAKKYLADYFEENKKCVELEKEVKHLQAENTSKRLRILS